MPDFVKDRLPQEVKDASRKFVEVFVENDDRIRGIKYERNLKIELRNKSQLKKVLSFDPDEARTWQQNLSGISDKFKNNSGLSNEDLEQLEEMMPTPDENLGIYLPEDLLQGLLLARDEFEQALVDAKLSEEQKSWWIASHLPEYNDISVFLRLAGNSDEVWDVHYEHLQTMRDAVEAVHPGSWQHQRMGSYAWDVKARKDAPNHRLRTMVGVAADEMKKVSESFKLRYGQE